MAITGHTDAASVEAYIIDASEKAQGGQWFPEIKGLGSAVFERTEDIHGQRK